MTSFEQSDANKIRADVIAATIRLNAIYTGDHVETVNNLIDLMANIRHYCDSQNLNFYNLDMAAMRLYNKQVAEGE